MGKSSVTNWPGAKSKTSIPLTWIQNRRVASVSCSILMTVPVCQGCSIREYYISELTKYSLLHNQLLDVHLFVMLYFQYVHAGPDFTGRPNLLREPASKAWIYARVNFLSEIVQQAN